MIDVNTAIRRAYFQALNGVVEYDTTPVPVYDKFAPNTAVYPFIILSSQTDVEDSVKNCQGHEPTILIDIVTGFTGEVKSTVMDDIAGQILTIIHPNAPKIQFGAGVVNIRTQLLSDSTLEAQNGAFKVLRRLLRFGHKIHEAVNT